MDRFRQVERYASIPPPSMEDSEKMGAWRSGQSSLHGSEEPGLSLWAVGSQR